MNYKKRKPYVRKPRTEKNTAVFEELFYNRVKQTPMDYIIKKIKNRSSINDIRYAFELIAHDISTKNLITGNSFDYYINKINSIEPHTEITDTKVYRKLVRDRIPEIISKSGSDCSYIVLDNDEYINELDRKLKEEVKEYFESHSMEELADILEVMGAIVKVRGSTWDELTAIRKNKKEKNGGFDKKYFLVEVTKRISK